MKDFRKLLYTSTLLVSILIMNSCKDDEFPKPVVQVDIAEYYGEWNGINSELLVGNAAGVKTNSALPEIMSLRTEAGKDTFNFKDPTSKLPIAGRAGTWFVVQVNNSNDASLNGSRLLRLAVKSPTRTTYTNLAIIRKTDNELVLGNDYIQNSRDFTTLTYTK
ncbi:MAG: hypothetical protein H7Y07_09495 [Pyrinomonadaceae bacterium]|nr:hypothetical protein [Sphingobacteriaceae bacterium]